MRKPLTVHLNLKGTRVKTHNNEQGQTVLQTKAYGQGAQGQMVLQCVWSGCTAQRGRGKLGFHSQLCRDFQVAEV